MAQQIKKKYLSNEVISYFDDQIDSVESGLAQELIDRASGDASTLSSSNSYTDSEVAIVQGEVDAVESALAQESLDRATGDANTLSSANSYTDSQITLAQANVAAVEADLAQEILDRAAADLALQTQINNVLSNVDGAALDSLTEIVSAFQSADASLNGAITALSTGLSADIASEASTRSAADIALQGEIDAEEIARAAADVTLQTNIDGKVSKSGDSLTGSYSLTGNISAGESNFGTSGFSVFAVDNSGVDVNSGGISVNNSDSSNISSISAGYFEVAKFASGVNTQFIIEDGKAKLQSFDGSVFTPVMPVADQDLAVKKYVDEADEALDARIDVLESVVWFKEKFPISNGQTSVTLSHTPEAGSMSAFVDRLAIHEGASEDYTTSGTAMTFLNDLVSPGQSQIGNGDTIYVKYQYKV